MTLIMLAKWLNAGENLLRSQKIVYVKPLVHERLDFIEPGRFTCKKNLNKKVMQICWK